MTHADGTLLLEQLTELCYRSAGNRGRLAGRGRTAEIVSLVVQHWPHAHLMEIIAVGSSHKSLDHAMALTRAQVREHWEARHGVSPIWALLLSPLVLTICHELAGHWFAEPGFRDRLNRLSAEVGHGPAA